MTTLSLGTPVGFSTPSQTQYQQIVATVTAPQISVNNITTGLNLEGNINVYLPVAPPGPVDVVVTSNGPAIATISSDGKVVGGTVLTFYRRYERRISSSDFRARPEGWLDDDHCRGGRL